MAGVRTRLGNLIGPRGVKGDPGQRGEPGQPPRLTAGTTTQVSAGEKAEVTLVQTGEAEYRVDARVPRGLDGDPSGVADLSAAMASEINTEGTPGRAALNAATEEKLSKAVKVQSKVRADGLNYPSVMLAPNTHDGIAPRVENSVILNPGNLVGMNNVIGGDGSGTVGTSTPNVVGDGSIQANISVIGGYDNVAGAVSSKIISDHSYTAVPTTGVGHNGIFGGQGHVAGPRSGHAGIIGGDRCVIDSFASVAGGLLNKIEGHYSITAGNSNHVKTTGGNSAVFGTRNIAEGLNSLMGGLDNRTGPLVRGGFVAGEKNVVTGMGGVATGRGNEARADYTRVGGQNAEAVTAFEDTYGAAGFNEQVGSAQRSTVIVARQTTDAAPALIPGTVPPGAAWAFEAQVVAVEAATQAMAAWKITGAIKCTPARSAPLVGTPTVTLLGADTRAAAWTLTVSRESAGAGKLVFIATGEAGKTIRWVSSINITQTKIPGV